MAGMSAPGAPPKLQVPRWIQLVALPLLLLAAWTLASAVRHALLIFLVSAVIAVLLNPIVHGLTRLRLPRGVAVLVVYLSFAAVLVGGMALVGAVVVDQAQSVSQAGRRTSLPGTQASESHRPHKRSISCSIWLNGHHLERVHVTRPRHQRGEQHRGAGSELVHQARPWTSPRRSRRRSWRASSTSS